jgi:hypothetical protein
MTYRKATFWRHKAPTQDIHWNRNTLGLHHHFQPAKGDPLGLPTRPPVSCRRPLDLPKQP